MTSPQPPLRGLLEQAVEAGILTADQAAAVVALDRPRRQRGAVLAEVLGYVGGTLAVVAALFLGAELWDELGPWPRVLLLALVAAAGLAGGAALGGRDGASGRLGGFLWAAAVVAVAATAGVGADGLLDAEPGTSALLASGVALVVAGLLWWRRPAVLQHVATFAAAVATLFAVLDRLGDGTFGWGGPLLWGLGLAWLAASALPAAPSPDRALPGSPGPGRALPGSPGPEHVLQGSPDPRAAPPRARGAAGAEPLPGARGEGSDGTAARARPDGGGIWTPAEPGWVLGAAAVAVGPLFAEHGRAAWLVVGAASAAALVVLGVRTRRPWVAAVGTGGVFLAVPLAVAELFDARLGPLVAILAVGLALVAAAVVLTRRAGRRPAP